MRWLPFVLLFVLAYVEISLFIAVSDVLGVATTLLLVIVVSCVGISLVRSQGIKTIRQIQKKIAAGESPAAEMVKSVSLIFTGFLLLIPGFFTDFIGLLLLLTPVQKILTLKLISQLTIYRSKSTGHTFEGEFQYKEDTPPRMQNPNAPEERDKFKNDH